MSASITDIRHHIKVVSNTRKLTNAMRLISSSKMKKAMGMFTKNHTHYELIRSNIRFILENTPDVQNTFFNYKGSERTAFLVIAGDKGLCGGYNQNVLKLAWQRISISRNASVFTIGHMASEFFARKNLNVDVEYLHVIQQPTLHDARSITETLSGLYASDLLDEVFVIFTETISVVEQRPQIMRLLPILPEDFQEVPTLQNAHADLSFHPSKQEVLNELVLQYLVGLIYAALVQSFASEQCARMTAMSSSTQNADEMLNKLDKELHRARQAEITQELSEIVSGAEFGRM